MTTSFILLNLAISTAGSLIAALILQALKRHKQP